MKERQFVTIEQARFMIDPESAFNASQYEKEHLLMLARSVLDAASRPGMDLANLAQTADKYIANHKGTKHEAEFAVLVAARNAIHAVSSTR